MAEAAIAALYRAIADRLRDNPSGTAWGGRSYAVIAPAKIVRPYVIYSLMGGGESNDSVGEDADMVILIKCVADTLGDGMLTATQIGQLFNDIERRGTGFDLGTDWVLNNCTRELTVQYTELIDGNVVWHVGDQYRFVMEGAENGATCG